MSRPEGYNGTLLERFERKYIPEPNSGCWLWIGAIGGEDDRGLISVNGGPITAHRVAWLLYCGEIPKGMNVLHTCDVPSCVNPDHLWLGSKLDNTRDSMRKGRFKYPPQGRGEQNTKAKLTEADVLEIRTDVLSRKEYAQKFGVTPAHISHVKLRRNWKHLA
jgi:hypothetical protein